MPKEKDLTKSSPSGGKKWMVTLISILGTLGLSGLIWFLIRGGKKRKKPLVPGTDYEELVTFEPLPIEKRNGSSAQSNPSTTKSSNGSSVQSGVAQLLKDGINPLAFPLKQGSKGPEVKAFQEYLIKRFGKHILPKYGADGDWGNETQNAVNRLGIKTPISLKFFTEHAKAYQKGII